MHIILPQLSMKNLSDIALKMSDDAGVKNSESCDTVKLHGGVNFISLDIDDAETLVNNQIILTHSMFFFEFF